MTGAGGDGPPPPASNGGEFLLSLLQKPNQRPETPLPPAQHFPSMASPVQPLPPPPQQPHLPSDPAVAAVGPTIPFAPPHHHHWPSNGLNLSPPWPHNMSPPVPRNNFLGFQQNPTWPSPPPGNQQQQLLLEDLRRLGFPDASYAIQNLVLQQQKLQQEQQQQQHQPQKLLFGSFQSQILPESSLNLSGYNFPNNGLDRNRQFDPRTSSISISPPNSFQQRNLVENSRELEGRLGKQQHYRSTPPPGFSNSSKARGGGGGGGGNYIDLNHRRVVSEDGKMHGGNDVGLTGQLERPGPPSGSNLHSVSALDIEESMLDVHRADGKRRHWDKDRMRRENGPGNGMEGDEMDDFGEELVDSLLPEDEFDHKSDNHNRNGKKKHLNSREKVDSYCLHSVFN